jgi:hypothetical protein
MTPCLCEGTPQHAHSPGLVQDQEGLCRGAFDPVHFNKSGIKAAFVRPQHLLAGELSVWRYERDPEFGVGGARAEIEAAKPEGNTLNRILAARAAAIRKFEVRMGNDAPGRRAFCVIDDCTTTAEGDWHSEHAVVRMADYEDFEWTVECDEFTVAKEGLLAIFKQTAIWSEEEGPPE